MGCTDIGDANADIAGIGVISAFAFQSIASFILSVMLDVFLLDLPDNESDHPARPVRSDLRGENQRDEIQRMKHDLVHLSHQFDEKVQHFKQLLTSPTSLREHLQDLVEISRPQEVPRTLLQENIHKPSPRQEARNIVAEILYSSSDTMTLAGIALALVGVIRRRELSLYQLHLVYDTINLTSVSNCAALASASGVDTSDLLSRALLVSVFAFLYLLFVILFGVHLGQWDDNVPGRCYNSHHLATPMARHPYMDQIYLGFTCLYMFTVLFLALLLAISRCEVDPAWGKRRSALAGVVIKIAKYYDRSSRATSIGSWVDVQGLNSVVWYPFKIFITQADQNPVLSAAMVQLPLHLYFIIRLRLTNEPLLPNVNEENQWGFGQIYTLITSVSLLVECCKGSIRYWNIKRHFKSLGQITTEELEDKAGALPDPPAPEFQQSKTGD